MALRDEIARGTMPGAVVAVARKGKLVFYESFGKLGDPMGSPVPKNAGCHCMGSDALSGENLLR